MLIVNCMKVLYFLKSVFLLSAMAIVPAFSQNYEINLTLDSRNDTVYLGHYFASGDKPYLDDTLVLKNGKGVFKGNRKLPKGVYFLFNDKRIILPEFLIGDKQNFGIVIDTTDLNNPVKYVSSPDMDALNEFGRYNADFNRQVQQLSEQFRESASDDERNNIRNRIRELQNERLKFSEKLIEDNKDLYGGKFLKSLVPPETYVPEPPRDENGNITDSTYQYRWYRAHYFDNFNIFDPEMLRTRDYEKKLLEYVTRVIPQHTDSVCAELDKMIKKAQANSEVFQCVLVSLYNHYAPGEGKYLIYENVWVHIVEKWYIPYSKWSTDETLDNLKKEVSKRLPNLIGKQAPPMEMLMIQSPEHFRAAALDTAIKYDLHAGRMVNDFRRELRSKYTVIIFWDAGCSHCKKAMQDLFEVWQEFHGKGMQVIAVQTTLGKPEKGRWIDFINENSMFGDGWINAWSIYSASYHELYNIEATPLIYILDEKFDIILRGRSIGVETVKDFISSQTAMK